MTKTRTTTATSIIPLLLLATACGTPTANPESSAPQTKTQTQTKTEKKPAPEPKKEIPAEEKPEEQTPTAPEPATDPTSGEWTEMDLNGISRWQKQDDGAADIKDNSHKRAKLEAFAEAQALISKLPRETVLDTMSHEDVNLPR